MKALAYLPSPSALSPPLKGTRLEGEGGLEKLRSRVGWRRGGGARGDTQDARMTDRPLSGQSQTSGAKVWRNLELGAKSRGCFWAWKNVPVNAALWWRGEGRGPHAGPRFG